MFYTENGISRPRRRLCRREIGLPPRSLRRRPPQVAASYPCVVFPRPSRTDPSQVGGGGGGAGDADAAAQRGGGGAVEDVHRRGLLLLELALPRFKQAHLITTRSCAAERWRHLN